MYICICIWECPINCCSGVLRPKSLKMASWLPGYCLRALVAGLPIGCLVPDKALGPVVGPGLLASLLANCWVQSWAAFELASVADCHDSQIIIFFSGVWVFTQSFFSGVWQALRYCPPKWLCDWQASKAVSLSGQPVFGSLPAWPLDGHAGQMPACWLASRIP